MDISTEVNALADLNRKDKVFVVVHATSNAGIGFNDLHYYGTLESSRFKLFSAEPSQDVPVFLNFNDSVTKQFFKIQNEKLPRP